jgi:hypothetical protein
MISKYPDYGNCKICNEIRDSNHGYNDDPGTASVQMYRHVPDCTDCKAMANLTNTHLAEIKVEKEESNEMDI